MNSDTKMQASVVELSKEVEQLRQMLEWMQVEMDRKRFNERRDVMRTYTSLYVTSKLNKSMSRFDEFLSRQLHRVVTG